MVRQAWSCPVGRFPTVCAPTTAATAAPGMSDIGTSAGGTAEQSSGTAVRATTPCELGGSDTVAAAPRPWSAPRAEQGRCGVHRVGLAGVGGRRVGRPTTSTTRGSPTRCGRCAEQVRDQWAQVPQLRHVGLQKDPIRRRGSPSRRSPPADHPGVAYEAISSVGNSWGCVAAILSPVPARC